MQKPLLSLTACLCLCCLLLGLASCSRGHRFPEPPAYTLEIPDLQGAEEYLAYELGDKGFGEYLPQVIAHFPESLSHDFSLLCDTTDLQVRTSADGHLRVYSWDNRDRGNLPDYRTLVQWRDDQGKVHTDFLKQPHMRGEEHRHHLTEILAGDPSGANAGDLVPTLVTALHQLPADAEGRTVYILVSYNREVSPTAWYHILALKFEDGVPVSEPFFVESDGGLSCGLDYEVDIPGWFFASKGQGWEWLNTYDALAYNFYLPIIRDNGVPSDRYQLYHFQPSGRMELTGAEDGVASPRLHPSLADYEYLEGIFVVKDQFLIRIDKVKNGYRYASWPVNTPMSAEPLVVAYAPMPNARDKNFRFRNNEYIYSIPRQSQDDGTRTLTVLHHNSPVVSFELI